MRQGRHRWRFKRIYEDDMSSLGIIVSRLNGEMAFSIHVGHWTFAIGKFWKQVKGGQA